jgi:secretion/DNA translocation related TadE-like protein
MRRASAPSRGTPDAATNAVPSSAGLGDGEEAKGPISEYGFRSTDPNKKDVSTWRREGSDRGSGTVSTDPDRDVSTWVHEQSDRGSGTVSTDPDGDVSTWAREQSDRGSGTVWMVALIGLIWSVATMAMAVGGVRAARHRAYAAADLAALAAASHFADGAGSACELAARIARGSGGRLRQCVFHGRISDVVVVSEIRSIPALGHLTATARARAGPERGPGRCAPPLPCHMRSPPN